MLVSVLKVRRYLRSNEKVVNTSQLLIHAFSFGIFVGAELFNIVIVSLDEITNTSCQVVLCRDNYFFVSAANFISQILLFLILLKLGNREAEEKPAEMEFVDLEVVEFDEEAYLEARIWNLFARQRENVEKSQQQEVKPHQIVRFSSRAWQSEQASSHPSSHSSLQHPI